MPKARVKERRKLARLLRQSLQRHGGRKAPARPVEAPRPLPEVALHPDHGGSEDEGSMSLVRALGLLRGLLGQKEETK